MYLMFFITIGAADSTVQAKLPNPAVSTHLLMEIMKWKEEDAQEDDITRLRPRTVPIGYTPTTWILIGNSDLHIAEDCVP